MPRKEDTGVLRKLQFLTATAPWGKYPGLGKEKWASWNIWNWRSYFIIGRKIIETQVRRWEIEGIPVGDSRKFGTLEIYSTRG